MCGNVCICAVCAITSVLSVDFSSQNQKCAFLNTVSLQVTVLAARHKLICDTAPDMRPGRLVVPTVLLLGAFLGVMVQPCIAKFSFAAHSERHNDLATSFRTA